VEQAADHHNGTRKSRKLVENLTNSFKEKKLCGINVPGNLVKGGRQEHKLFSPQGYVWRQTKNMIKKNQGRKRTLEGKPG
jgi:hypothetical protein